MPYIDVKLTTPMPSQEQLDRVAKRITEVMVEELGKAPERVVINFEPVDSAAFYFGGKSVRDIKAGK